jgi:UDP-N-acetyl-2-amino-2-deoxyglucuronate dehydrogenase
VAIHVGLIGGGNITDTHARAVRAIPGVEIVAICASSVEKARGLCGRYGGTAYDSVPACLDHRPMDLVAIGSPSGLHAEQGIAAARRRLHVLVEKPMDVTVERADALVAEAEAAGVKLGVFFQDRFEPDVGRLKDLIDGGHLGRPLLVDARVPWYRPPEYYATSRWRGTRALDGGGALMNQGIHTVDLLLWLLGDVARVQGRTATLLHRIEVEDTALALLEFRSGAIGLLAATTAAYPGDPRRVAITGSEGTAVLEQGRLVRMDLRRPAPDMAVTSDGGSCERAASPVVADARLHQAVFEDFLAAIQTGRRPRCDGQDGRRSVALVQAIYDASRTGTRRDL